MRLTRPFLCMVLAALLAPAGAAAYVTSATLEYSSDDVVGFWLNGKPVLPKSDFVWADYAVLSTSDGTLPLSHFNMNGDNVLAVRNFDSEGQHMGVSYRLTVHHSSGDPVVVWSEPGETKFLHLGAGQPDPQGWERPEFNDSSWAVAREAAISKDSQYVRWHCLEDENFGFLGSKGCVPFVSHVASARSNGGDRNLLRSRFKFPNVPAKVRLLANASKAARGQQLSFRLIPGPDASHFERFQLFARVPQGLSVTSVSQGGYFEPKSRALFWDYAQNGSSVGYLTLNARSVLQARGWSQPEKVLGPPKKGKVRRPVNVPASVFDDGAKFGANEAGWFALDPVTAPPAGSVITGVIFHSQIRLQGQDSLQSEETDPIHLNYSLDGSLQGALPKDVRIGQASGGFYWIDGYYDASEDRDWAWKDLAQVRVKLESRQRRVRNTNMAASISLVLRYFIPGNSSPYFYAMVDAAECRKATLLAGLRQTGQPAVGSDPLQVVLNDGACPPTPVPTPSPIPTSTPMVAIAPTPEPTRPPQAPKESAASVSGGAMLTLGCLENSPQPFKRGGTFVWFCVDKPSDVSLFVYRSTGGAALRTMHAGSFRPGKSQIFFNGMDDKGKFLPPGQYMYEVRVTSEGLAQSRNSSFSKVKD